MIFQAMTQEHFDIYLAESIPSYASAKSLDEGYSLEDALELAKLTFTELLPDGLDTKDHYLYLLEVDGEIVGNLWLCNRVSPSGERFLFIYDIEIKEDFRGMGYSKSALYLTQEKARELGVNSIGLHVFGSNKIARNLYKGFGFVETNIVMKKDV